MTVQVTTLHNGIRVVSENMPGLETASLGVWVDVGSRAEPAELNGVSHMLEHMAFKGTRHRSARQIVEEIEAVGGHINAYTSREHTAYLGRVLADDIPLAIEILGDILRDSVYAHEELERERSVIVQELGDVHDTPDDYVFDLLQGVAFPSQPVGRPVLGTLETVRALSRDALLAFRNAHYSGGTMVFSAAGKVDHDDLVCRVQTHFGDISGKSKITNMPARFGGGFQHHERQLDQAHLALGLPGFAYEDDDFYAAQVYSAILGGGMSSRLFQEVREQRGLAYTVFSFSESMTDNGLFGVYAGTAPDALDDLIQVISQQMAELCKPIDGNEVERAKNQLKAGLLMGLESSSARCEQFARQLLVLGHSLNADQLMDRIDSVNRMDVARVGQRLIGDAAPAFALIGPPREFDPIRIWDAVTA